MKKTPLMGWQPGSDRRVKEMARGLLAVMAVGAVLFFIGLASSGCCTFCNTGSLSGAKRHIPDVRNMVQAQMEVTP